MDGLGDGRVGGGLVRGINICGATLSVNAEKAASNQRFAWKLSWIVLAGLLFGFALAPLYSVVCKLTGLNGKTDASAVVLQKPLTIDESRWVTVIFTGNVMPGLGWSFHPTQQSVRVHPGQITLATYSAKNITDQMVTGQAVPSVAPELASLYFKKIECFCFRQQGLKPGESKEMPLRFYVSPDLPKDVPTVTLSYAFYNIKPTANQVTAN